MEVYEVTEAFASLAQETRLKIFRLLIAYGADGRGAGKLARELKIPDNTLSFHLSQMARSGLVRSERQGRSITYFANAECVDRLIHYLQKNCCAKQKKPAENCAPRSC